MSLDRQLAESEHDFDPTPGAGELVVCATRKSRTAFPRVITDRRILFFHRSNPLAGDCTRHPFEGLFQAEIVVPQFQQGPQQIPLDTVCRAGGCLRGDHRELSAICQSVVHEILASLLDAPVFMDRGAELRQQNDRPDGGDVLGIVSGSRLDPEALALHVGENFRNRSPCVSRSARRFQLAVSG